MKKTVLCIIDGLGVNLNQEGNAVHAADMKNLKGAIENFPSCELVASGTEVGLVDAKDPGNRSDNETRLRNHHAPQKG